MPAPISVPAMPIATVSQAGIGSGPGRAKRARAPVTNPMKITAMTLCSIAAGYSGVHVLADPRRRRCLELAEEAPGDLGDVVDRALERRGVRLGRLAVAADLAHELQRGGPRLFLVRGRLDVVERVDRSAHQALTSSRALSSRRKSLISSRSFAAYSNRSSSAATYISSSSVTASSS